MKKLLALTTFITLLSFCMGVSSIPKQTASRPKLNVTIKGSSKNMLDNVNFYLTENKKLTLQNPNPTAINDFYGHIPSYIQRAVAPFGYFKPRILSKIKRDGKVCHGLFNVILGLRLKFTKLDAQISGAGQGDLAFQKLLTHFPIKSGDYFSAKTYENAKQALSDLAVERGYFHSQFKKSKLVINLKKNTVHVIIHFHTGNRHFFGATHFTTISFSDKFLRRFLRYHTGQYYNNYTLQSTRQGLANSDYFQQVIVFPKVSSNARDLIVPVTIKLTPQTKKQYMIGTGCGTDSGPRALLGVNFHWINKSGHRFKSRLICSKVNSVLSAEYIIPGDNPISDQYTLGTEAFNLNPSTGKGKGIKAAIAYQTVRDGWEINLSLTHLEERYNLRFFPKTNAHLLYPSLLFQRTVSDHPLLPTSGYRMAMHIMGAHKHLLSKTTLTQIKLDSKFLFSPLENIRLIFRGSLGHTEINNIGNLPLSLQFAAGGAQSIRGFSFNSIGAGRDLFTSSIEWQQLIKKNWYLTTFIDIGNVSNNISREKLNVGAGVGLAWWSPIGILEATIANAMTKRNQPWVLQFSMGPAL